MWMSDARVICAVWGCARCLLCVCVSVWPLGVFREERGPFVFAVRSALAPIRPVICLRLSVLPFVNGTIHPLSYLIYVHLCLYRTLFTQGSFVYVSSSHFAILYFPVFPVFFTFNIKTPSIRFQRLFCLIVYI